MLLAVNPLSSSLLKSRASVPVLIRHNYLREKEVLARKLQQSLSKTHFAIDTWTAPSHTGYEAIIAQFVSSEKKLVKALIPLHEFKGTHSGEEQARVFLKVLDQHKIKDNVGYITTDNAAPNDSIMRYIERELSGFDAVY